MTVQPALAECKNPAVAKLTAGQVLEIRRLYATGRFTQRQLGATFSIHHTHVGCIVRRTRWSHL